jgi:hypothetical protein
MKNELTSLRRLFYPIRSRSFQPVTMKGITREMAELLHSLVVQHRQHYIHYDFYDAGT